uniref:Cytochrome P450 n=1 Tax=Plectus sambesii TaxID=2011161 RepID=A0A914XRM1_9BILA
MISLLLCAVLMVAYLWSKYISQVRQYPPGPRPLPILGNLLQIDFASPQETIAKWGKQYGPVFTVWLPKPNVVITDYSVMKEALVKEGDIYAGRYVGFVYGNYGREHPDGSGIILSQNKRWSLQRRFALHVFRDFGIGRNLMETKVMAQCSVLVDFLRGAVGQKGSAVVDLEYSLTLCVANIIDDIIMGRTFEYDDENFAKFKHMLDVIMQEVKSPRFLVLDTYPRLRYLFPGQLGYKKFRERGELLHRFFLSKVSEHKAKLNMDAEPEDYIDAYLHEIERRKRAGEDTSDFNEEILAANISDLWAAGMETTVTTLRWGILYIMLHPEVARRVYEEVDRVVGKDRLPQLSDRSAMPYTQATLNEIQRLGNIVPFNIQHATSADTTLHGHKIAAGTIVLPQLSALLMDPDVFPQPHSFLPERFLAADGSVKRVDELIPFGMGKRQCLGESLARTELFLIFVTLMQKFSFSIIPDLPTPTTKAIFGVTAPPHPYATLVSSR